MTTTTNKTLPQLLTEKELATRLCLSVQTLRNHRFQGRGVPYMKIGSAVRYKEADVYDWLEKQKIQPEG